MGIVDIFINFRRDCSCESDVKLIFLLFIMHNYIDYSYGSSWISVENVVDNLILKKCRFSRKFDLTPFLQVNIWPKTELKETSRETIS